MAQTTLVTPCCLKIVSMLRHMALYWSGVPALPLRPLKFGSLLQAVCSALLSKAETSFSGSCQMVRKILWGATALIFSATCLIWALTVALPPPAATQVLAGFQLTWIKVLERLASAISALLRGGVWGL